MTMSWTELEQITGVARPNADEATKSLLDRPLSLEEYWLLNEKIETAGLSPRLERRYKQIIALMHHTRSGIGKVLGMRVADLHNALIKISKTMPRGKQEASRSIDEIKSLFSDFIHPTGNPNAFLFPVSVHRKTIPISRAKIVPELLQLADHLTDHINFDAINEAA